jgi:molybdopterin converting factor subunit 1
MIVHVRLFAAMAQHAGTTSVQLDLADGTRSGALKAELLRRFPALPWPQSTLFAINQEYGGNDSVLYSGDEVAIIPPVSGG